MTRQQKIRAVEAKLREWFGTENSDLAGGWTKLATEIVDATNGAE